MRVACLSLACCCAADGQQTLTTASLTGSVVDPSGAVLVHAPVVAKDLATAQTFTTETDAHGRFRLPYLPVGEYRVTTQATGFEAATQQVSLTVGAAFDLKLQVPLSPAQAQIQVNARPPVIEENRSQISETVLQAETAQLPFQGRNSLDFALLLPGVSPTNTGSTQTLAETSEVVGQGYSINSQRNFSNSFVVDGLSGNDDAAGVAASPLSMDAIRDFQVVTSGGQAEFGRAMGGYINVVTRSGANQVHGTAYGFLRNQRLNAANALARSTLPITQGQYGASLSGPVRKDRTFIFSNYEEQRLRSSGVIAVSNANAAAINSRLVAVGYRAPLLPTGSGATTQFPTTLHTDTLFLRGDQRFGGGDQLTGRYSFYQFSSRNARGTGGLNEVSNGTSVFDLNHTISIGNIASLSPRLFNETRAQFMYDDLNAPPNDPVGPAVTISGVAVFGRSTSSPTERLNYLGEIVDNMVIERGAHTFKAGIDFLQNDDTITFPQSLLGSYTFSSFGNFLSGIYNSQGYTQNFGDSKVRQGNPNIGLYGQDEWKLTPALTLNLGVRYDLEFLESVRTDRNNVSPRVGVAWSPFRDRRSVVRASYGVYYDRVPLRPLANALLSANNTTDVAQAHFLSYTFSPTDTNAPVFPLVANAPPPGAKPNFTVMSAAIQNPYAQQASLELEQQVLRGMSVGFSYQHVRGEHLISSINTNINPDGSRPDPARGNIKPYSSVFDSYFDGLEVSLLQRPSAWGSMRLSYTWSKAIDNVGEFFFSSPINNFDSGVDRARSDDDQRHRVVFDATLNSPHGPGSHWEQRLSHGWRLSGILQYYSRLPFNITTGGNTRQATSQRPCAGGYTLASNGGLNPCTEALQGTVIGRNAGVGFDLFSLNGRLSRSFRLGDHLTLEGIAEAFNALNHRNDMIPNGTFGTGPYPGTPANASFGQATAVGDPRNVQIAIRLSF